MKCKDVEEYLIFFIDGDLEDDKLHNAIDKHLKSCEHCKFLYDKSNAVWGSVQEEKINWLVDDFFAGIENRIDLHKEAEKKTRNLGLQQIMKYAAIIVFLFISVTSGMYLGNQLVNKDFSETNFEQDRYLMNDLAYENIEMVLINNNSFENE